LSLLAIIKAGRDMCNKGDKTTDWVVKIIKAIIILKY
jgi:hypothetical protein